MKKLYTITFLFVMMITSALAKTPIDPPTKKTTLAIPTLNVTNSTATEGTQLLFYVTLSEPNTSPTIINVCTATGTANFGDYTSISTTVTVPTGATYVVVAVLASTDNISEGTETMMLKATVLSSNTANIVATGTGTIIDATTVPALACFNSTVTEGNIAVFIIALSNPSSTPTVINCMTINGSATSPDDFTSVTTTRTIIAGATMVIVLVPTAIDFICEATETFTLNCAVTSTNTANVYASGTGNIIGAETFFLLINGTYNDFNNDGFTNVGDIINCKFTAVNSLCTTLNNVSVSSSQINVTGAAIATLPVGASNTTAYTGIYTIKQNDINNNFVSLDATAIGYSGSQSFFGQAQKNLALNITKGFKLNAFIDTNSNGFQDAQEVNFLNGTFKYQMNNGVVHYVNSSTGVFYLYEVNSNNVYSLSYLNANTSSSCSGQFNVSTPTYTNITIGNSGIVTYNFALTPATCADLAVYLSNYNEPPRPGFIYKNCISYKNQGNQTIASGVVTFTKSNIVSILSTSPVTTTVAGGFTYNFSNLLPGETRYIIVSLQMPTIPTVTLGQIVTNAATISVPTNDVNINNNNSTLSQVIVGSYDPNDKAESHGPKILHSSFTANDYLTYKIQFENTGTANAITVKVNDDLHSKLDETTLQMIDASHNYVLDRTGSKLEWKFSGIDLPPSVPNTQIGHGYVIFQIKPKVGYAIGDIIPNTANIYFDFNPAIVTNTWTTEFVSTLGTRSFGLGKLIVYPNPSSNILIIQCQSKINSLIFSNILGQVVLSKTCNDMDIKTDISNFANGTYFVRVKSDTAEQTVKILKE